MGLGFASIIAVLLLFFRKGVIKIELIVPLDTSRKIPFYEQIYQYIKEEIKKGNLKAKDRLPSTRVLAENLKVSRSTTQLAYDQLMSEGYVEAVPCKGYFIAAIEELVEIKSEKSHSFIPSQTEEDTTCQVDFSPRGIDLSSFPFNAWRKITRNTLVDNHKEMFLAGDPQGEPSFREAIRSYLHSARGVNCRAEQIIVGAGSEYLLMLLHQILGGQHVIAMENPTYKQAYRVFCRLGYEVLPVEMDQQGMEVERLEESRADIAYVMPSHQYPTGIIMPIKRRQRLLAWAYKKEGRYLIEDDYDSEFRYKGKPIPSLQGTDTGGRVIYIGTFSKSIAPAIRVGYLVLPEPLLFAYREKCGFYASTVSRIDQSVLYQFLVDGYYERHLNRMRAIYKGKHDTLMAALKLLEDDFTIKGEHAGLHVLLTHKFKMPEEELVACAKSYGVRVYSLSSYFIHSYHNHYPSTVVLGYANLTEKQIREGVELLARAWKTKL